MNKLNISAIALAISLSFSASAMAEGMAKSEYMTAQDKIAADYKAEKSACSSMSGNAGDICVAEAKGKEKIARADLEDTYKPSTKNRYNARVAKAEVNYAVANERCDDLSGNAKDICVKEAKAAEINAKADAKAQMKTTDAVSTANEKSADARTTANEKSASARKDANTDKRDAQYSVAKEKCDTFAGSAKDHCLDQAKVSYGGK